MFASAMLLRWHNASALHYDTETDLHYNWHRDYNPKLGRYVQSDPIGLEGGWNVYNYVGGNPIQYTDKRGLKVYVCKRPVNISGLKSLSGVLPEHYWLKTDKYESGMGGECDKPGQGCADLPFSKVVTKDHTGQSKEAGSQCFEVKNQDEECVNDWIKPGLPLGNFRVDNNCVIFVNDVLHSCYKSNHYDPWKKK